MFFRFSIIIEKIYWEYDFKLKIILILLFKIIYINKKRKLLLI